jgi:hypothetical protein
MLRLFKSRCLFLVGALSLIAGGVVDRCNAQNKLRVLERSAHCSVTAWLSPEDIKGTVVTAGYAAGTKISNDFGRQIYLVTYVSSDRRQGYVFDIGYKEQNGRWVLLLQNNAKFVRSGKDVNFVEPALGGTWTQEHLIEGIERIGAQSTSSFQIRNLLKPDSSTVCRSYSDPDRQASSGKDVK